MWHKHANSKEKTEQQTKKLCPTKRYYEQNYRKIQNIGVYIYYYIEYRCIYIYLFTYVCEYTYKFNVKRVKSIEKWVYSFPADFVTHHKK